MILHMGASCTQYEVEGEILYVNLRKVKKKKTALPYIYVDNFQECVSLRFCVIHVIVFSLPGIF